MPLIIAATDFTIVAENACNYACNLALAQNAEILLLHCYSIPVAFSDIPIPTPLNDVEKICGESMKTLAEKLHRSYPQLNISTTIIYGNIIDAIEEYTEKNEAPMLVVAGNSYNENNPAWMDSTLLQAFRHLRYPILAIPPDTSYTAVRKIGFAYDNKYEGSDIALVELREFALKFDAELHVFFAQEDVMKQGDPAEINEAAKRVLEPANPLYHVLYESDVDPAIEEFVAKYSIDWLVVMPRKHSFFDSLFHKSHTKMIMNHSFVPIMALHHN